MIHPHTELRFISDEVGYGVVATQLIPKGTVTWVQDNFDRVFLPYEVDKMDPHYKAIVDKYTFRNNKGSYVLCWDISRFVNHSFNSNCITTAYDFEIAVRDIYPGEELTDDYGYLNVTEPFDCLPEKGARRTRVMPDDLLHYYRSWDRKLREAFHNFKAVSQPLSHLILPQYMERSVAIAEGKAKMDSIRNCYFKEQTSTNGVTAH